LNGRVSTGALERRGISLDHLGAAIAASWTRTTSSASASWTVENPALGQCAVTALVIQDYFGGDLLRAEVCGVSHYWNRLPDGRFVDLTRSQFQGLSQMPDPETRDRDYVLSYPATLRRYDLLRDRVAARMMGHVTKSSP
jgi:hypothetical protein